MIKMDAKELLAKLLFVHKGTSNRPLMPAYGMVLFTVKDRVLTARSFNNYAHTKVRITDSFDGGDGEMLVSVSRTISALSGASGDVAMTLDFDKPELRFRSKGRRWADIADYGDGFISPPIGLPQLDLAQPNFADAIRSAVTIVDAKTPYGQMKGVHVKSNGSLQVVGTDGLSFCVTNIDTPLKDNFEDTIPIESIDAIIGILSMDGGSFIGTNSKWVAAQSGDYFVASMLIQEAFPNYAPILESIPVDQEVAFVNAKELVSALALVAPYADESTRGVAIELTTDSMIVRGYQSMRSGEAVAEVTCSYKGGDCLMTVDFMRLSRAVKALHSEDDVKIVVSHTDEGVSNRMTVRCNGNESEALVHMALMRSTN